MSAGFRSVAASANKAPFCLRAVTALACLGTMAAHAQDAVRDADATRVEVAARGDDDSRLLDIGTVVVYGQRNPLDALPATTVVRKGKDIIDKSPMLQGVDILRTVPGLQVSTLSQGAFRERFTLRGFTSAGEAVASFLDGVPLNESNGHGDGTIDLSTMIPEEIDRVEVIKGAFSPLYGNFARAGSISFVTKNRVNENLVSLSQGSWNTQRAAITLGRSEGGFSQYYAVDTYHTDGFRARSETSRSNIAARWSFDLSDRASLRVGGRGYSAKWDSPGYLTQAEWDAGEWQMSNTEVDGGEKERYDLNVNYNYQISESESFGLTAFYYDTDFHRWRDNGSPQTEEHNLLTGKMIKGLYSKRGSFITDRDALLIGVDVLREDGDRRTWNNTQPFLRGTLTADGDYYQTTYSLYSQFDMKPTERIGVTLGIRYDYFDLSLDRAVVASGVVTGSQNFSNDMKATSPKIGVAYKITDAYTAYANFGKSFYLPTTFDKFLNAQLKPVDVLSYEAGLRFAPVPRLHGSVALFRIDAQDDVTRQGGPTGPLVNSGDIRRQGVELEFTFDITKALSLVSSATYVDAEFRSYETAGVDLSGNVPIETPPYFYGASLEYFNENHAFGARLSWNGKGEIWLNNDNNLRYGSYKYGDAQLYKIIGPYTLDLKLGNITEERYAEYAYAGAAPGSERYGPARPRNATLSFRVDF